MRLKHYVVMCTCAAVVAVSALTIFLLLRENRSSRNLGALRAEELRVHCNQFAAQLRSGSDELGKLTEALKKAPNNEERQRLEQAFDSYNGLVGGAELTPASRRAVASVWYSEYLFCALVRAVPDEEKNRTSEQFKEYVTHFSKTDDRETIAGSVSKMAELASDVATWPIR